MALAVVFSDELNAVVAILISGVTIDVMGDDLAGMNTIQAMPLYRVAELWTKLQYIADMEQKPINIFLPTVFIIVIGIGFYFFFGIGTSSSISVVDKPTKTTTEFIHPSPTVDVEFYLNQGNVHFDKSNYNEAIASYTEAIRLKPDYVEAFYKRGYAYSNKREYDKAIADYNEVIHLEPDHYYAYNNRGFAHSFKGNRVQAIADYSEAIRIKPDYYTAYYNRGYIYEKEKKIDKAISDYKKVVEESNSPQQQQLAKERLQNLE